LPLSLPDARWPTWPARRASGGFAPRKGAVLVRIAAAILSGNTKGFALSFPNPNHHPRVAGFARWPAPGHRLGFSLPLPSSPEGRAACRVTDAALPDGVWTMGDLILNYRACGAECREDWLRLLAHDNGLPLVAVQQLADELGEREDFGELVRACECDGCIAS